MKKSLERWAKVCPKMVALSSQAHVAYLVSDAKADIAELGAALARAEHFIAGFEGDSAQENVDSLLSDIRRALGVTHG
ncbi:hypothetical protein [Pseudomonas sp.]|uniref:hypothetical protein n=1 Tax=Pseudomonas sp. TaxID=306 RepID=UPI003D1256F3